jgi:hypothetical protein
MTILLNEHFDNKDTNIFQNSISKNKDSDNWQFLKNLTKNNAAYC